MQLWHGLGEYNTKVQFITLCREVSVGVRYFLPMTIILIGVNSCVPRNNVFRNTRKMEMGPSGSSFSRLSENTKSQNFGIDTKGFMTRKFTKTPILGQPGEM